MIKANFPSQKFPQELRAPKRSFHQRADKSEVQNFRIPELRREAEELSRLSPDSELTGPDMQTLREVYALFKELGSSLLNNDKLFGRIQGLLTNTGNFEFFQRLVNEHYPKIVSELKTIPKGYSRKIEIKADEQSWIKFSSRNKNFEMKLDSFELIYINRKDNGQYRFSLVPNFIVRLEGDKDGSLLSFGFETSGKRKDSIFVESAELFNKDMRLGLSFIRPGHKKHLRLVPFWSQLEASSSPALA